MGWGKIIDIVLVAAVVTLLVGYAFTVRFGQAGSRGTGPGLHANADSCCGHAKMARCLNKEVVPMGSAKEAKIRKGEK